MILTDLIIVTARCDKMKKRILITYIFITYHREYFSEIYSVLNLKIYLGMLKIVKSECSTKVKFQNEYYKLEL